ncbi:MAG: hypothetical protein KAQ98_09855 [Bacteriovoracaceae bacterium]|nr:hypothetical protein [Bacteriovoracaceae bacterium]
MKLPTKALVLTTFSFLLMSFTHAHDLDKFHGCGQKPELKPFLVTVSKINNYDYCYSKDNHSFPCHFEDQNAQAGDLVLGYVTYDCVDIGHLPGYFFEWISKYVPVKIITK